MSSSEPGPSASPQRTLYATQPFLDGRGGTLAYRPFRDEETDLPGINKLCEEELSEPQEGMETRLVRQLLTTVYTFRYFLTECPHLTFFVYPTPDDPEPIATIICQISMHRDRTRRGYIGMLGVDSKFRRPRKLVELAIARMDDEGVDEVVLETEYDNASALALYEALGFVREKRLHRFYSNGKDAFRLILILGRHPLLRRGAEREVQMKEKQASLDGGQEAVKDELPPDIAFVLAGPQSQAVAQLSRLSLDSTPPPRPAVPNYIM